MPQHLLAGFVCEKLCCGSLWVAKAQSHHSLAEGSSRDLPLLTLSGCKTPQTSLGQGTVACLGAGSGGTISSNSSTSALIPSSGYFLTPSNCQACCGGHSGGYSCALGWLLLDCLLCRSHGGKASRYFRVGNGHQSARGTFCAHSPAHILGSKAPWSPPCPGYSTPAPVYCSRASCFSSLLVPSTGSPPGACAHSHLPWDEVQAPIFAAALGTH